jgi:hypothetical protein
MGPCQAVKERNALQKGNPTIILLQESIIIVWYVSASISVDVFDSVSVHVCNHSQTWAND